MTVLALPNLYDLVAARFAAEATVNSPAPAMAFGWREREKQKTTAQRIVWVPGDESGSIGEIGPTRSPGRSPRSLGTLHELFTVAITAVDKTSGETNERAQYEATRLLYDAWYRAVYLAAHGAFEIISQTWNTTVNDRRFGAEIVVVASIQAVLPDALPTYAPVKPTDPAGTHVVLQTSELSVTDTETILPA